MIIDAKSAKTRLMIFNLMRARGSSKTFKQLAIMEAYIESLHTGKPVELKMEMVKIPIE